jgi:hypothetical protein
MKTTRSTATPSLTQLLEMLKTSHRRIILMSVVIVGVGLVAGIPLLRSHAGPALAPKVVSAAPPARLMAPGTCDGGSNVDVESTGGTALAGYATVKLAFDAINAGTHTGTIIIEICSNTTEGATPATLNSSGAGAANYLTINMYPIADGVVVTGNPATGFGVIQLKGADGVTIDGDNPNTAGINRNLTINNTNTATAIAGSVIRIATAATVVTSANNITLKNMNLNGNVTGGNASGITSNTGSSNSSFGIYAGGNGGATATDAPTAITSVTAQPAPTGTTINALIIDNNAINQTARGVVFNGASAGVSSGITISNNTIGASGSPAPATPPWTSPATTVYSKGIWIAGTTAYAISGNTIQNIVSFIATTPIHGIEINAATGAGTMAISNNIISGVAQNGTTATQVRAVVVSQAGGPYTVSGNTISNIQGVLTGINAATVVTGIEVNTTAASATIEKNKITKIYNINSGSTAARGINLAAGNNITVKNNFVSDILASMTGGFTFDANFGTFGIRVAAGTGHRIYNNSVNMPGTMPGTATSNLLTGAFCIAATSQTGMDVRNNIFANTITGGTTSVAHVSMFLPTNTASAMTLTLNNNDYFSGTDAARQGIAQANTTPGTGFYLAANFNAGVTTPAANLRALTTQLGPATNDDNSKVVDPLFVSATDLHVPSGSPMVDAGATIAAVSDDIDGQARPQGPAYDIGADELLLAGPGTLQFSSATYSNPETSTATITVARSGGVSGAVQVDYATVAGGSATGGASCMAGVDYIDTTGTLMWANLDGASKSFTVTICNDGVFEASETVNLALSNVMVATLGTPNTAVLTITDAGSNFSGSVNVGTGEIATSLTNVGGIFQAINSGTVTGDLTINLTSDLTAETGTVALNEFASPFTVTIKPSGAPRVISGTSGGANTALIKLNGADGLIIDGSTSGGTDRSLTITNLNTTGVNIWIATNATSGASNNTVKNCNLFGNAAAFTSIAGVIAGSGATFGGAAEFPQNNNTIRNNLINRNQNALFLNGNAATLDQNWTIADNSLGSATVADKLGFRGMLIANAQNFVITNNAISGISSSTATNSTMSGIQVFGVVSGGTISRNVIKDIRQNNTAGWGSNGIYLTATSSASNLLIANNFVSDIASQGFNDINSVDNGYGIMIDAGGGYNIYYNTVVLNTNQVTGAGQTAALNIDDLVTTAGSINLRDNIFASTQTTGTRYGVLNGSTAAVFGTVNYNDYFAQNVGRIGATTLATLAAWQGGTGQDANSLAVNPLFVSATDLHLQGASPVLGLAIPIAVIDNDIDNDLRDDLPDIGADEITTGGRSGTLPSGTFRDGRIGAAGLSGNITFTGTLTLTGIVTNGPFTLTINCGGSVTGATTSNYIIGNLRKMMCATGNYDFEVGTASGFSPVNAGVTAIGGGGNDSLAVRAVEGYYGENGESPALSPNSLQRYWDLNETGSITADMTWNFLAVDVVGMGAGYRVIRINPPAAAAFANDPTCPGNPAASPCVNISGGYMRMLGVSNFSSWTAGQLLPPTATGATISGRVQTAGGRGVTGVKVMLVGGGLTEPREVVTGKGGQYEFTGLPVGQTYVITVAARRYTFAIPTIVLDVSGDIAGANFVGEPTE